jgi:prepilin-type N-terminal cleavage/methylation domain-containing protein
MRYSKQKGFTLLEVVVVLGIFGVLSGIVIFNYGKFRSDTTLVNMAYEVALSIREAQIYGVSARSSVSGSPDFDKAYGIHFQGIASNQYLLFSDNDESNVYSGTTCASPGSDTCVTPYTLQSNIIISDVAILNNGGNCPNNNNRLDIVFKRPNPEPIINDKTDTSRAQVTLTAPDGAKRYVIIYNNGQVTVENESICS